MRKLGNNRIYPVITVIIAFMSLVAGIPYCRHSVAERHNVRAVHDVVQCPEGASAHLLKAIKLNPGNPVAHLNLGLAYLSQYSDMALEGFITDFGA